MSLTLQPTPKVEPDPGSNYTPAYREFFGRLRRARIDKGLSIADMSDAVGLTFKLAHEFENLLVPLPFDWLEVWCKVVGVPFADYLVVYWDSEEAYFQKLEREREAQETEAAQEREGTPNAPAYAPETEVTKTATPAASETTAAPDATAPSNLTVDSAFSLLVPLRAAFARVAGFLRARFSTPKEKLI